MPRRPNPNRFLTRAKRGLAVITLAVVVLLIVAPPGIRGSHVQAVEPAAVRDQEPVADGRQPEAVAAHQSQSTSLVPDTDSWGQRPEQIQNPFVRDPLSVDRSEAASPIREANIPRFHFTVRPADHVPISELAAPIASHEPAWFGQSAHRNSGDTPVVSPIEMTSDLVFGQVAESDVRPRQPGEIVPALSKALSAIPDTAPGESHVGPISGSFAVGAPWFGPAGQPTTAAVGPVPGGAAPHPNDLSSAWFGLPNRCENAAYDPRAFIPNPDYSCQQYNPDQEFGIYRGKFCVPAQGPWVELGRGLYRPGPLPPTATFLTGETNPIIPHFLVFGDLRTAIAYNDNGNGDEATIWASRLNLDFDLKITSTERIHAFWGPLDRGGNFTRAELRDDNLELVPLLDNNLDTLFFEGDLGYIWGGMTDRWAPFDLPVTAGRYPLLFQNGVWLVDILDGFAFNFPGKNSPVLDWSNYEITFFFALNNVTSPAFVNNSNVELYGVQSFIEAYNGYLEVGYAFLNDQSGQGFSYHNLGISFTRRYFQRVSSSFRAILNAGQDPRAGAQTADGQLFLWENALVTQSPNYFVPYVNAFLGLDRPQAAARAAGTGGVLFNTGINFETDGLTNYPTLDATGNNTWGGACGINLLGPDFSWQLVTELAMVQTFGQGGIRTAVGDEYAVGTRFQLPLNNAWIWRVDGIYGIRSGQDDIRGARTELRWKF